ncbi:MAG TPA: zinc-dependent peptidase [Flavobacterium sp.]|jgi:hypothetical protein
MLDQLVVGIVTLVLVLFVAYAFVYGILNIIIEPIYVLLYNRPIYTHWYLITKKLSPLRKKILIGKVPFFRRLSVRRQGYFEHRVATFIKTYEFQGKSIEITDEIQVLVASAYVMLTFGMRNYITDVFDKILIYPDSYHSTINEQLHNGEFNPHYGAVVFSWKHFREGFEEGSDNLNLGIHEFAHVLHYHGLKKGDNSSAIFADRYARIMKEVNHPPNAKKLIESDYFRIYAYTNQFEFLAVILEHFFETPQRFKQEFPQLYENVRQMINFTPQ